MNSEYIVERLIAYALLVLIPLVCYFLAGKLIFKSKHKGKIKRYLAMLIASLICFLFFIVYGILANEFDLSVKILNPIYFILVPISFLSIVIFFILFFVNRNRKRPSQLQCSINKKVKGLRFVLQRSIGFQEAVSSFGLFIFFFFCRTLLTTGNRKRS